MPQRVKKTPSFQRKEYNTPVSVAPRKVYDSAVLQASDGGRSSMCSSSARLFVILGLSFCAYVSPIASAQQTEIGFPLPLNSEAEAKPAASVVKAALPHHESRWTPLDVDEQFPAVVPGSECDLAELQRKAGAKIEDLVKNVERFTATKSLFHESINKSGKPFLRLERSYDYIVSIAEIRQGILDVQEFQNSHGSELDVPGGMANKGLPALVLIFHPYYTDYFAMKCEGLSTMNGQPAWQVYFRQRDDKPKVMRSYKIGINGPAYPVELKGRAWFTSDSFELAAMQTDLARTIPEVELLVDHTTISYGPVHFSSRGVDIWLPRHAEVYGDFHRKRFHERADFSDYLLFAVDDKQSITVPKAEPPKSE